MEFDVLSMWNARGENPVLCILVLPLRRGGPLDLTITSLRGECKPGGQRRLRSCPPRGEARTSEEGFGTLAFEEDEGHV